MIIYADVLFVINFVTSCLMLWLTGAAAKRRAGVWRLTAASAIGGFTAVLSFTLPRFGIVIRLLAAVITVITAFGWRKGGSLAEILIFLIISAVVSAVFTFLSSICGNETVRVKNGIAYFDLPVMRFVVLFAAAYAVTAIGGRVIKRKRAALVCTVIIRLCGKEIRLRALCDSGNTLREPISGKSVIIAEWEKVKPLFDAASYEDFISNIGKYRLRIVPYHSLGNKNGMIFAFLADDIIIYDEKRSAGGLFVGVTNETLSKTNAYNALTGTSV